MKDTLLIGIGNAGRGDDGLGWAFADCLQGLNDLDIVCRYQLQVEDAELISRYRQVWFVDATHQECRGGFECEPLTTDGKFSYTTHALHPAAVLQICEQVFRQKPDARLLAISGAAFGLGQGLSETARANLDKSVAYFREHGPKHC